MAFVLISRSTQQNLQKIEFFWEELVEDAHVVCEKVKEYAEKIRVESIDAIEEISLSMALDDELGTRADRHAQHQ